MLEVMEYRWVFEDRSVEGKPLWSPHLEEAFLIVLDFPFSLSDARIL